MAVHISGNDVVHRHTRAVAVNGEQLRVLHRVRGVRVVDGFELGLPGKAVTVAGRYVHVIRYTEQKTTGRSCTLRYNMTTPQQQQQQPMK